ncbi:MAG TPA: YlmC/YmxH family sporulation protein [Desulfitobacteriaceae bacterium]|nr:YlmC/YmxH family sporulation protein [Desulfitobacteriaceae bacterium]
MFLSDLGSKEIINLFDGAKLGLIGDADLAISSKGEIEAIILTSRSGFSGFFSGMGDRNRDKDLLYIPWQAVKKVGSEVIIVDLHNRTEKIR